MGIEYLLTSPVLAVTPGTGVLYTVTAGLSRGTRARLVAALGCTLGIVPHVAAAVTGLAALLHTSAVAFQVLKYLGVAYLLFSPGAPGGTAASSTCTPTRPLPARPGRSSSRPCW